MEEGQIFRSEQSQIQPQMVFFECRDKIIPGLLFDVGLAFLSELLCEQVAVASGLTLLHYNYFKHYQSHRLTKGSCSIINLQQHCFNDLLNKSLMIAKISSIGISLLQIEYSMKEEGAGVRQATEGVDPSHLNLRNKGVKTAGGKLHRGCVKDAFSKLSIGSIPSNYESIIYRYEEKKGFGTSQKRFYNPTSMSEMLKAEIDLDESIQSPVKTMHASHSTKGFGPFIAKEKRQWRKYTQTPGPGKYFDKNKQHPGQSPHIKKMHSYTRQRQDFKRKELAMNKQNHDIPGPGYYEYQQALDQHSLGGCKSSFVTKSTRQAYINKNNYPGPGRYHSDQPPVQEKKKEIMEEQLYTKLSKQKQTITSQFLPRQRAPQMPGPGYYDQQIPNFKPLYERIKISHNFIKGSKERLDEPLGYLQVTEGKGPTPCTYEVAGGYDKMQRKLIDMSSFMSESRRIVFEGSPSCSEVYYDKVKDQPKNFHFNISGKWV